MKVGLAFVSEQIFNNLFRGGLRSDESGFPLLHLLHYTHQYRCLFASFKPSSGNIFNHSMS